MGVTRDTIKNIITKPVGFDSIRGVKIDQLGLEFLRKAKIEQNLNLSSFIEP